MPIDLVEFIFLIPEKKETPLFNTKSDNKEQKFETVGQSKSVHGNHFQLQASSRVNQGLRRGGDT